MGILSKKEKNEIIKKEELKRKKEIEQQENNRLKNEVSKYQRKVEQWKLGNSFKGIGKPASIRFLMFMHGLGAKSGQYVNYEKMIKEFRLQEIFDKIDELGSPPVPKPAPSDEVRKELEKIKN